MEDADAATERSRRLRNINYPLIAGESAFTGPGFCRTSPSASHGVRRQGLVILGELAEIINVICFALFFPCLRGAPLSGRVRGMTSHKILINVMCE